MAEAKAKVKSRIVGLKKVPMNAIDAFRFGNPRSMSERMKGVLSNSIDELGYLDPIMVREVGEGRKRRYEILNGHHRYMDLSSRSEEVAEVLVVDVPDDAAARKIALSLNRIGADWNADQVNEYIDAMISDGAATADELVAVTGFDASELDALAAVGASFLDDLAAGGESDDEPSRTRGGTQKVGDAVKIQMACTPTEHSTIYDAIRKMRASSPDMTAVQALAAVCDYYNREA